MKKILILGTLLGLVATPMVLAPLSGASETAQTAEEPAEGPHGGRLLERGGFALEVTIFETGIPPEMRLYPTMNGQPVDPATVQLTGKLGRLGGVIDNLTFKPEKDYLVSDQEIVEPHSFDVSFTAAYNGNRATWSYDSHEGRAAITDRMLAAGDIGTEVFGNVDMTFTEDLFGVVKTPPQNVFNVHSPYKATVRKVHVSEGEIVMAGDVLATLTNTRTLQSFELKSPASGMITDLVTNTGDVADNETLFEITDHSTVWTELSVFPNMTDRIKVGQSVAIADLEGHQSATGTISWLSPGMVEGHIIRARVQLDNSDGHWHPDMHVKGAVTIRVKEDVMAVRLEALQTFRDMDVVFGKFGNMFEVRMLELGERNDTHVEVLGGIAPGTTYVTRNSFVLKADVLKDGASHDH